MSTTRHSTRKKPDASVSKLNESRVVLIAPNPAKVPGMRMSGYDGRVKTHELPFPPDEARLDHATNLFRALSDPTRVLLLLALGTGERVVGDLVEALGRPQSTVSRHLAALRQAGLVATRRDAARVYYRILSPHVVGLLGQALSHADHVVGGIPHEHQG